MPYAPKTITGVAGGFTYNGVNIQFKHWSNKLDVNYADATDSATYDPTTQLTWRTQKPGDAGLEGEISGNYDINGHTATFLAAIIAHVSQVAIFKFDASTTYCTVPIDLMDFETGVEIDGANMVEFKCNYKSNGIPTFQVGV